MTDKTVRQWSRNGSDHVDVLYHDNEDGSFSQVVHLDSAGGPEVETDPIFSASEAVGFATGDVAKLAGIETGAEVNNISDEDATELTGGGETNLHTHAGTGPETSAPTEIGVAVDGTDAKTYTWLNGWYIVGPNTANMPADGLWWYVHAFVTEDSSVLLQAFGTNGSAENVIFILREENGTWNAEWIRAGGIPETPTMYIEDLQDVDLSALQDGQVLVWDEGTSTWISSTPGGSVSAEPIILATFEDDGTDVATYEWLSGWYFISVPYAVNMPSAGPAEYFVHAVVSEGAGGGIVLQAFGLTGVDAGKTFIATYTGAEWALNDDDSIKWFTPTSSQVLGYNLGHILGFRNIALGDSVLGNSVDISGKTPQDNTGVGNNALESNTSGLGNTAIGQSAEQYATTGDHNTAVGHYALLNNIVGGGNVAIGNDSLMAADGNNNVAIGYGAGSKQEDGETDLKPNHSVYIGHNAKGRDNSDENSIVIGNDAVGVGPGTTVIGAMDTVLTKLFGIVQATGDRIRVDGLYTPTSATDSGTAGDICWDSDYLYVCVATDTWKRSAISTWS